MFYQQQQRLEQFRIIGKPVHQVQILKIPFLQLQLRYTPQPLALQLQHFSEELQKAPMEVKFVKSTAILFKSR